MSDLLFQQTPKGLDVAAKTPAGPRQVFFYSTDARFRTHIHPLNAPGSAYAVTRFRPADHPWQYGIFTGLNAVNGLDFWCCGDAVYAEDIRGAMRHRGLENVESSPERIAFTAANEWLRPDGRVLLEERQSVRIEAQDFETSYAFDFNWEIRATQEALAFGESKYGGLSARLTGNKDARRHLNSEGQEGDACAEQDARWASVAQPVDGLGVYSKETSKTYAYAGVAILEHPSNVRHPNRWRVDNQGMINPAPQLKGPFEIAKGEALKLRYRLFVFLGTGDAGQIEAAWQAYAAR